MDNGGQWNNSIKHRLHWRRVKILFTNKHKTQVGCNQEMKSFAREALGAQADNSDGKPLALIA